MPSAPPGLLQRWQLTRGTVAPILIALAVAVGAVVGFVLWATNDLDRRSLERETRLIEHIVSDLIAKVPHDQETVAIWDDAVEHTKVKFDADWVDTNLGGWMKTYFDQDRVFVLDAANKPIYAMDHGEVADVSKLTDDQRVIAPLAEKLRQQLATGALDAYENASTSDFPEVVDVAVLDGMPAIIGVLPIASDTHLVQDPGTEFLHVGILFLDAANATRIANQYLLENARFTMTRGTAPAQAAYPIMSKDGRFVAFFEWQPDRPGQLTLNRTAPALAGAFVIGGIIIFLLLDQLWRSSVALIAGRLTAQHQSRHDPLTGLPNRIDFDARLAEALKPSGPRNQCVALLMLDLDSFKKINDTLGHQAGDDLIRAVSQRLREIIGERDTLTRIGGDEFAVIHPCPHGEREALLLSERIIEAVRKPFDIVGSEAFVGMSIGVAVAEAGDTDSLELVRRADIALYEAKGAGRNRAIVFEAVMNELLQGRHAIESELRDSLRRGDQLSVAFQPLYSSDTLRIVGAEALARWLHPRLG